MSHDLAKIQKIKLKRHIQEGKAAAAKKRRSKLSEYNDGI